MNNQLFIAMDTKEKLFADMSRNASEQDIDRIRKKLGGMNRGKIAEIWDKVISLWKFVQDPEAPWAGKAIAIGALIYLVSPIDAIPDFIPVAGLTDDVGIILVAIAKLASDLNKYKSV